MVESQLGKNSMMCFSIEYVSADTFSTEFKIFWTTDEFDINEQIILLYNLQIHEELLCRKLPFIWSICSHQKQMTIYGCVCLCVAKYWNKNHFIDAFFKKEDKLLYLKQLLRFMRHNCVN